MKKNLQFGVIGYGRFGTLWTRHLARQGHVTVYDKKKNRASLPKNVRFGTLESAVSSDILFLLVPISEIKSCCATIAPLLSLDTIVLDACSVKEFPAKHMVLLLPSRQPLIATHPLFGPDSTKKGLRGKKIVVCPLRTNNKQRALMEKLFERMGLDVIFSDTRTHDKAMARSQALVHFIGRGLQPLNLTRQKISTPDYDSLISMQTMVHDDSWQLFLDMQTYNPYARTMRKKFIRSITAIEQSLNSHFPNPL